jgi:DNA-binding transcriptional regulator YdaS (Cro superfamily)
MNAIQRAVSIVGSQPELGRRLGVTKQNVSHWVRGRRAVPAEYCPAIERETAGAVRCEELRPDVEWAVLREGSAA